jgi:hypothetical protein
MQVIAAGAYYHALAVVVRIQIPSRWKRERRERREWCSSKCFSSSQGSICDVRMSLKKAWRVLQDLKALELESQFYWSLLIFGLLAP